MKTGRTSQLRLGLIKLNHYINSSFMETIYMPRVIDANYLHDYYIHVVFSNGKEGKINLSPFIGQGVFEPLSDLSYFKKLFVDGWTISWPNGADIAPETLYELIELSNNTVNE